MLLKATQVFADLRAKGLVHGFTTRKGGVSEGPYESLNLGRKWGDDPTRVDENFSRVMAAAGLTAQQLWMARQVHGAVVLPTAQWAPGCQADGLFHQVREGVGAVGVLTADCVPILLADEHATAVAAVHSGWRGTAMNIAGAAVAQFCAAGVSPDALRVAIGPCIEVEAFEVGEDVAANFPEHHVRRAASSKPHVDLVGCVVAQLQAAGVHPEHIERVGGCTWSHPEQYFSYRRFGANTGQHLSFIGVSPR